jgi:hypothetical protein
VARNAHRQRGQTGPGCGAKTALQVNTVVAVRFSPPRSLSQPVPSTRQTLSAELSRSTEPSGDSRVQGKIIGAHIAFKKGDPRQAIRVLTDANNVLDNLAGTRTLADSYDDYLKIRGEPKEDLFVPEACKRATS